MKGFTIVLWFLPTDIAQTFGYSCRTRIGFDQFDLDVFVCGFITPPDKSVCFEIPCLLIMLCRPFGVWNLWIMVSFAMLFHLLPCVCMIYRQLKRASILLSYTIFTRIFQWPFIPKSKHVRLFLSLTAIPSICLCLLPMECYYPALYCYGPFYWWSYWWVTSSDLDACTHHKK